MTSKDYTINPELDLVLEREIDVPPALVWEAWTTPKHIKAFFAPRPWTIRDCEIDLRPGGLFTTTMLSPEGDEYPNAGCYLEIVPNQRLVWTDALGAGYRPSANPFMTAVLIIEPRGEGGSLYRAIAVHRDVETRQQHEAMGFQDGWGTVLDQLVEHIKAQR